MIDNENNGAVAINGSNTVAKRRGQFVKGDKRINRKGRPRSFDEVRKLAQAISHEEAKDADGNVSTVADAILRQWAQSKEPILQKAFIEYAFGKVPDKLEASGAGGAPLRPMVIQVITPAAALVIDRECPSEIARSESVGLKGLTMKVKSANEAAASDEKEVRTLC